MKPHEVATRLKIATSTVRQWAAEYREFMSPHAAGGEGQHRSFIELDMRVLYFIREAKQRNERFEEIEPVLKNLQEDSWTDLPYIPEEPNMASVPMVPEAAAQGALDAERRSLLREISFLHEQLKERDETYREQLKERDQTYREQIQNKDMQLKEQHERIATLMRELGEVDVELRLYRSGRLKPEG